MIEKFLYDALQAENIWGTYLQQNLIEWNFQKSSQNQNKFYIVHDKNFLILIIVVDDMAFASSSKLLHGIIKHQPSVIFKVKLLGCYTVS